MQVVRLHRAVGRGKGRQPDPRAEARIDALLGAGALRRDLLIEYLHRIQDADGCLRAGVLAALAVRLGVGQAEVFEVATFYHHFDFVRDEEPAPPALTVRVCDSLSCAMAGSATLLSALRSGGLDGVRLEAVPCVGRCAQAPVAIVGRAPVPCADVAAVRARVESGDFEAPEPLAADPGGGPDPLARLRALIEGGVAPASVCDELERAGLRGMGGAGFPAGRKWRIVAAEPAPRHLVVNADEGEPGTFKDRFWLEQHPQRFLEGMLVAAWATGCASCTIYLRDEYAGLRRSLAREIASLRRRVSRVGDWDLPSIDLRRGAGAYVCGEESALIESVEGRRGMPRLRPPYVAQAGLFGRPTLAHNVETLCWVPEILARGAAWFAGQGRRGRKGLRSFSVSGRVSDPGVRIAPAGISLRELIDEHCGGMAPGHRLRAFLPGGASGGILPASLADEPLDFDVLQRHGAFIGSAAVIVLSQQDSLRDAARNLLRFFRDESCGQCTPCRVGTAKMVDLIAGDAWDEPLLSELSRAMVDASICGLGQAAPNPVLTLMRHFPALDDGAAAAR